jgi:AcrR family transcriptional regulator
MSRAGELDVSRREQSKATRRDAILGAARSLIRELGPLVSAEKIAQRAGVATATVYNLIGPREQLLGLLLSDLFEDLRATIVSMNLADPFLIGDAVVVVSAKMFISDSSLWLHVLSELRGALGARVQPFVSFQPINLQRQAMQTAKQIGMLNREADAEMTATQIYAAYNGALFLWAGGYLSDEAFLNHAKAGYWAILAALGTGDHRRRALGVLNDLHRARARALLAEIDLEQSRKTTDHAVT